MAWEKFTRVSFEEVETELFTIVSSAPVRLIVTFPAQEVLFCPEESNAVMFM